ncbi:MAG: MFS transporter [Demequinaceae bacterium]|nr:MFS transporter [Demequinaceae bacterium]
MTHSFVPPTRRQVNLIVLALLVGMFLASLDQMVVATAIRTIGDDLNGLTVQAWVTTAYMVAATLATPLYGKLSDIFGRKPFYVTALGLFVLGSTLCSFAESMYELAAYRAIQGAGAGGLMALAIMILGDILAPRERTRYQAAFFAVWGVSSVLGPVLGGFFAGADQILGIAGWRWIFLLNVPLGAAALVLIVRVLHVPHFGHATGRIDWSGVSALVVAIVPLLVVLERGNDWGWRSSSSLMLFAISLVGWVAFVAIERSEGDDALLPLRMFRVRTVAIANIVNFIMGFAMFGGLAGLPLYLQISRGMSPTRAGLAMIPFTVGILLASVVATRIIHITLRYKWLPVVGAFLLIVGTLLLSLLSYDSPFSDIAVYGIVFGSGLGCIMQPLLLAVQNALPAKDNGAGTASVMFSRQIGGSLGAAVFLSILFGTVADRIKGAFLRASETPAFQSAASDPAVVSSGKNGVVLQALATGDLAQAEAAGVSLDDTSFLQDLHPEIAAPFRIGFSDAINGVMLIAAAIIVVSFVISFFLPSLRLSEKSGLENLLDEKAAAADAERLAQADAGEAEPTRVPTSPPAG